MTNQDFRVIDDQQTYGVRASAIIIKDNKLLTYFSEYADHYYLPGGAILVNELTQDGVKRELLEEMGVTCQVKNLAYVLENQFNIDGRNFHQIEFLYFVTLTEDIHAEKVIGDDLKERKIVWFTLDELEKVKITPHFLAEELPKWNGQVKHFQLVANDSL
ncbi:hypothetical protein HMPREF9318_00648 [Streptococcus urinalis FB127-CNA-2]|uniref:Hydrolase, NUDIX family n=1 Tax=Streptococcus urinalis 2285-97 TaxID=764291 RepID=G5KH10_9STRE|nr:NUDIX domain-containing protein [Streptococcus urinalis]EHJ56274.1 hydrolase, NUDIX family [Streptococcus urinalis 2285-97]EKS22450.1 hypothetical protein HMPREF9318_00648 [Streptococcus urinalis FB127-CNA-2]VEF32263.1 MutT/nudix family protein [Streptococcus urinalis]